MLLAMTVSYSQHVSDINFPAVTLCNPNGADSGEYVRAMLNNLEYNEVPTIMKLPICVRKDIPTASY